MKKFISLLISLVLVFTSFSCYAYSIREAYDEFKTAHPTFISEVSGKGISESLMISFLTDVSDYLKEMHKSSPVTRNNFDSKAMTAINRVSAREKYITLQDALLELYPEDIAQAIANNTVTPKFRPLVETVKDIIFRNNMLSGNQSQEIGGGLGDTSPNEEKPKEEEPTVPKITFSDVPATFWGYTAIGALAERFIISGYLDNTFRPNENITRAEFAKIIIGATNSIDIDAKCEFSDVKKDDWYYIYVASAMKKGYITGYPDGTFRPNEKITRQDICTVVYRSVKDRLKPSTEKNVFIDEKLIAPYSYEAVYTLYSNGIINGMGNNTFAPKSHATRAQTAKIIYSTFFD